MGGFCCYRRGEIENCQPVAYDERIHQVSQQGGVFVAAAMRHGRLQSVVDEARGRFVSNPVSNIHIGFQSLRDHTIGQWVKWGVLLPSLIEQTVAGLIL